MKAGTKNLVIIGLILGLFGLYNARHQSGPIFVDLLANPVTDDATYRVADYPGGDLLVTISHGQGSHDAICWHLSVYRPGNWHDPLFLLPLASATLNQPPVIGLARDGERLIFVTHQVASSRMRGLKYYPDGLNFGTWNWEIQPGRQAISRKVGIAERFAIDWTSSAPWLSMERSAK